MNRRIVTRWMREGVTRDGPGHHLDRRRRGARRPTSRSCPASSCSAPPWSREDAVIGPDTTLKDCEIGAGARVVRTHGELAVIGDRATVGPFAYLRPGTQLGVGGQDRHLRRDQERPDRRRRQGAAPVLRRRRRDRRGHQHRRRHDLRQLRRRREAPHHRGPARQDRLQQHLRRAGRDRRRRRHRRAAPSYAATSRPARSPSAADRSATSSGWALSQAGRAPPRRTPPRAALDDVEESD